MGSGLERERWKVLNHWVYTGTIIKIHSFILCEQELSSPLGVFDGRAGTDCWHSRQVAMLNAFSA